MGQAVVLAGGGGGQHQCDGFGQIADNAVAFLEQPVGQARDLCCPFAQAGCCDGAFGTAACEKGDGPKPVFGGGSLKIIGKGCGFDAGLGAFVDAGKKGGKILHASASSAWSKPSP